MKRLVLPAVIVISIAILTVTLAFVFILSPRGNEWIRYHLEKYLTQKLHTTVKVGQVHFRNIDQLTVSDFSVQEPTGDSLTSFKTLSIQVQWEHLYQSSRSFLTNLRVEQLRGRIIRSPAAARFNYQFLLNAFASSGRDPGNKKADINWLLPDQLEISDVSLKYQDALAGSKASIAFMRLNARIHVADEVVPTNWIIQSVMLDSAVVDADFPKSKTENQSQSDIQDWSGRLKVADLQIRRSSLKLQDAAQGLVIKSVVGHFRLTNGDFAPAQRRIYTSRIELHNHFTTLQLGNTKEQASLPVGILPFQLSLDTIILKQNRFLIDLKNRKRAPAGTFGLYHNDFQNIDITAVNLRYNSDKMSGRISKLSFVDARQFRLHALQADLRIDTNRLLLTNLNLRTARNTINGSMSWSYPSWDQAVKKLRNTQFTVNTHASTLNLDELTYFLPVLRDYPNIYPLYEKHIRTNVKANGTPQDIRLSYLNIATDNNHLQGTGRIRVPEKGDVTVMLDIRNGTTGKRGLLDIVSSTALSPALLERIPEKIRLSGQMHISARALTGTILTTSSAGLLRLKGSLTSFSDLNSINYNLTFDTRNFNLAPILKDTLVGFITAHGKVRGVGLADPASMTLEANGYSDQIMIGGQRVRSVLFNTQLSNGRLASNLASSVPDLNFELSPTVYFRYPDSLGSLTGMIYRADLQKIGLTRDSLAIGGSVSANLSKCSPDSLIGTLNLSAASLQYGGKTHHLDQLALTATHSDDQQVLQLKSSWADLDLSGQYKINRIPDFINNLSQSVLLSKAFADDPGISSYHMSGHIHLPAETLKFTPLVSSLAPFSFTSAYKRDQGSFKFQTVIDSITIDGILIDSAFVNVETRANMATSTTDADYTLGAKNISGPSVTLPNTQIKSHVSSGVHGGELTTSKNALSNQLKIPFTYDTRPLHPFISIGDSLHLWEAVWKANPGNTIYPLAPNFAGSNLTLTNGSKSIAFIASDPTTGGLPYHLTLANIKLGPFFALVKADSTLVTGSASGSVSVSQLQPLALTSRIDVQDLRIKGAEFGALNVDISSKSVDQYALNMALRTDRTILSASGIYEPSKGKTDLSANIASFPLSLFRGIVKNEIDSLRGGLSGQVTIRITPGDTVVEGRINLDSTMFDVLETGSRIQVAKGGLILEGDKINLDAIQLRDGADGQAVLTGYIDVADVRDPRYRLKLNAKRFKTIGELGHSEQLVYGNGKTDANFDLSGNFNKLQLTGQIALNDSAQVFYRNTANLRQNFGEGLLEFTADEQDQPSSNTSGTSSLQKLINANISIPSNATLTLILDEYRGEKLVVRGHSKLNYSQHAGGEMQLNGKYEVTSGTYTLVVGDNIRKEFTLENGGTIQWMGNLDEPICDLTAIYKVNTSAGALMQGFNADAGRRKFDFSVKLKLKGNLTKPDISFEIGMREIDQDAFDGAVYSKIKEINSSQQEATKQVMSLLVLNSFMGDSPFGSLSQFSSTAFEAGAYNTIGNLLTRQLNNVLAGMVKAVDITLGVNWSESMDGGRSSTRSDIKLGIGKSLFNHRLNLYVGNNFGIETLSGSNTGFSGLANDISVEYLLDPEGKYRIKGYHVRDNELTLHGEHMETGVEFTIIWEFDGSSKKHGRKKRAL